MIPTKPSTASVALRVSLAVGQVTLRSSAREASTYFMNRETGLGLPSPLLARLSCRELLLSGLPCLGIVFDGCSPSFPGTLVSLSEG